MWIPLPRLSLAASMRMIDRVHHHPSHMWSLSFPTTPTGLPDTDILVIDISDLPDGRHTDSQDSAHFPGFQTHLYIIAIPPHDLRESACASNQLAALSGLQFKVMDGRTKRHIDQWQRIPRSNLRLWT